MAEEGYKNNTKSFMISRGIWRLGQRYNQIFYRLIYLLSITKCAEVCYTHSKTVEQP